MADETPAQDQTAETPADEPKVEEVAPAEDAAASEEPKAEEPKAEESAKAPATKEKPSSSKASEDKPEPSGKFKELIKQIETMSVLELSELVKALEERFGVSAAAPMMVAGGAAASAGAAPEEEKTSFTLVLQNSGDQKIAVIKAVREINQELGLKEAKDLVDAAPKTIKENLDKEEAKVAKQKLEAAGATVELK